mmetsp:Transcript_113735/g.367473  ORF Transcript_113735/g.367473 Transcript_113735/m.367473 type:complete len:261 (+) Transcript_113735:541-1323(+)
MTPPALLAGTPWHCPCPCWDCSPTPGAGGIATAPPLPLSAAPARVQGLASEAHWGEQREPRPQSARAPRAWQRPQPLLSLGGPPHSPLAQAPRPPTEQRPPLPCPPPQEHRRSARRSAAPGCEPGFPSRGHRSSWRSRKNWSCLMSLMSASNSWSCHVLPPSCPPQMLEPEVKAALFSCQLRHTSLTPPCLHRLLLGPSAGPSLGLSHLCELADLYCAPTGRQADSARHGLSGPVVVRPANSVSPSSHWQHHLQLLASLH